MWLLVLTFESHTVFLFTFNIKTAEALPSGKKQYPFIAAGTNGVNKCNGYINGRSNWFPSV